eukprot:GFKZ01013586.1.p1 GENE.GFKZ01013586.1~~GFKZ01013586.1.p1  ORF type:complete len:572 (-),score=52.65 GFKZ01013586.1:858-2573(-)
MKPTSLLAAATRRKKNAPPSDALSTTADDERPLNFTDLVLLGLGGTLGSGLFLLTGHAARYVAGPAVTISFVVAAVACLFSALSYAEMSSRNPNSGGAYAFAYAGVGELAAFIVGMCLTLEYGVSSAAVARSWASYLGDALGFLPGWATGTGSMFSVMAFLLVITVATMLSVGLKEAKWVINAATIVYALVVVVILIFGSIHLDTANWDPFVPFGINGIVAGSSAVFFAYIGFDEVAAVAEEAQDAARSVPLAILCSLTIVSLLYVGASLVLTGLVKFSSIDTDAPFSAALRAVGLPVIATTVGFGTALGMMNTTMVGMAAQPRIFVSMGRDGLLPRSLSHSTRLTTIGCGLVVAVLAFFVDTQALADVVSGGTLLAFLATNVSLLLTRARIHSRSRRVPTLIYCFVAASFFAGLLTRLSANDLPPKWLAFALGIPPLVIFAVLLQISEFDGGPAVESASPSFLCPFVPLLPLCGTFTTTFLLLQLSTKALSALCSWLVVSALFYFSYSTRHAIIARDFMNLNTDASPSNSYNSFDNLAMEANSICSDSEEPIQPFAQASKKTIPDAPLIS